jgi:hypothetical protein
MSPSKLLPEWIEHTPEAFGPWNKAESSCACGIKERHRHCLHCGRVVSKGDWAAPGVHIATIRLDELK